MATLRSKQHRGNLRASANLADEPRVGRRHGTVGLTTVPRHKMFHIKKEGVQ